MLHDMLKQLGEHSRADNTYWQKCLDEVHRRTMHKNFTPASLEAALTWLKQWQQENQQLPANLQLELLSLQLTSGNHLGETHVQQVAQLLPLINALTDESPQEACQAVLRIAIRSSHLYDFNGTTPLLQQWLDYPVAVPGLLNHGKLHSSMGQLHAFQGQYDQALASFGQALASFERLSDQHAAQKDLDQTRTYRAIALQDIQHEDAVNETLRLVQQATGKNSSKAIEYLSRSGSTQRFQHYLLLRLLISRPELADLRQSYLSTQEEWSSEDNHPWHLIAAYRAWLLHDAGQLQQAAQQMQIAIDGCFENGNPMLSWMGHCLQALAASLKLKTRLEADTPAPGAQYPAAHLPQLAGANDHGTRLLCLQRLLPFNFH
jgi:tetratricopeptide (TPR) repeat protein